MKNIEIPLKIINLLKNGEFYSKKQLTKILGSQHINCINEYLKIIHSWGVKVLKIQEKGYRLITCLQLLNKKEICLCIPTKNLTIVQTTDSTNQYLIDRVNTLKIGDVCTTEYQTNGRGRHGRQWIALFGTDICLSIYWQLKKSSISTISLMIGIVVAEMLQNIGIKMIHVKWPNDIYFNNRKLAGILVETCSKNKDIVHVIIGIGINLMPCNLIINEIKQDWSSLQESKNVINRNILISKLIYILRSSLRQFENEGFLPFIIRWPFLDIFFNLPVKLITNKQEIIGINRGIDYLGRLLLEHNGKIKPYLTEKVSLRRI